ncbi:MAG: YsnF/AvaK domain-containing protein [Ktedonobacteraceae bacterium]
MAMTEQQVAVGVFVDHAAAEQAIQELQRVGFSNGQIKYSVQKGTEGILDGLVGMGIPYSEADFYNNEFFAGRTIVAVKANQRQQEAHNILRLRGAYDAHERVAGGPTINPPASNEQKLNEQTVQVREEQLQAQKRWVQTEEIRIHRRVVTEEKIFKVPVSREEVYIERVPLNTPSTAPVQAPGQRNTIEPGAGSIVNLAPGQSIKLPVREERVMFQKVPMIIEEITLTKRLLQETKPITETVQHENVHLERSGNVHIQGDNIDNIPLTSSQTE